MGTGLFCVAFAIGVAVWTTIKEKNMQKQKTCECKCFDAGYLQACEDFENMLEMRR